MARRGSYVFEPSGRLGVWLRGLLVASVVVNAAGAIVSYAALRDAHLVLRVGSNAPPPQQPGWDNPVASIGYLLSLATIITWLVWQHRVTANVWARGIDIKTTPGWAVGWWFVPVAAAFTPAVAVARVYRASAEGEERRRSGLLVTAWWLAYVAPPIVVVTVLVSRFVSLVSTFRDVPADGVTTVDLTPLVRGLATWAVWLLPVTIAAGALAVLLVSRIDRAQERMAVWVPPRPDLPGAGAPRG